MKTTIKLLLFSIAFLFFIGCVPVEKETSSDSDMEQYGQEFKGKIDQSYEESEEWWPKKKRPAEGSPNVIIFLLDDVRYAQVGSFGGLIETPNIDNLAANGSSSKNHVFELIFV